ncbi:rCG51830 [Rattus norvegicus]|uniref:RCG51830 n=1 Tax=Rattus norvegicus TaxID=10116 RepID=A6K381_RAT|nr:rCG51830 [Rattus norvegicus]
MGHHTQFMWSPELKHGALRCSASSTLNMVLNCEVC